VTAFKGRPAFATDDMVAFLDAVAEEAAGSADRVVRPRLEAAFGLSACHAAIVVTWWRAQYRERFAGSEAY
jgi:hypothetical protein